MYLHIGQSVLLPFESVLGVFDLDNSSWSYKTRAFLERAEKEGRVVNAASDLPRSFVLCREGDRPPFVYLSQLSTATLKSRLEGNGLE